MSNHIFFSAASMAKLLDRTNVEHFVDLPLGATAQVNGKELRLEDNRIILPIHAKVPIIGLFDFDIVLEEITGNGTAISTKISHIGSLPEAAIAFTGKIAGTFFKQMLLKATVNIEGNKVTVDINQYLPQIAQDIRIESITISNGLDIAFEY
jgi:hypothetical protein